MSHSLHSATFGAMGGRSEVQVFCENKSRAEDVIRRIVTETARIEDKYSRYQPESVLSQINASAGKSEIEVDEETAALLDYADVCYRQSKRLFDISSGVLRKVWRFRDSVLPEQKDVEKVLQLVGWGKIVWQNRKLRLPEEGMELDLGGIAKEYAVDRAAGILLDNGFRHALVNFAGDLRVCGPRANGTSWMVGIANPNESASALGAIPMMKGAMATSGDYERRIEIDGKRYSHILNPRTGWPVAGIQSVTVFAPSCLVAGSMSTTAMLLGPRGESYLKEVGAEYILITSDGDTRTSRVVRRLYDKVNSPSKVSRGRANVVSVS